MGMLFGLVQDFVFKTKMSTKIPKPSCLKPPTKILKFGSMATINEGTASSVNPTRAKAIFRRRSKSTSDLRVLTSKPLASNFRPVTKPVEKSAQVKIGQKRPATGKNDVENKPKVPKVKIPDWDYKSRFHELQNRHKAVQEDLKDFKAKAANLPDLQQEVESLRQESQTQQAQLKEFIRKESLLTEEKESFLSENIKLKSKLTETENTLNLLKTQHQILQDENEGNVRRIKDLEATLEEVELTVVQLTNKNENLEKTTQQLKEDMEEAENLRRQLHNTIQDMKGNIRVFCRVRPPINNEEHEKLLCAMFFPNDSSLEIKKSRESVSTHTVGGKLMELKQEFSFDKVFPPEANQAEVFEELAQLVQSALDGYHVCVFAYGQTGSGKTYTMQGSPNNHGMIPRTVDLIFDKINKLQCTDWCYNVTASFLEIYNENIRDLLVPNSCHNYELRYNEGRGVTVTNLKVVPIGSAEDLKLLMEEANKNRAVAATDFNEHSSRSHAVTKIHLEGYNNITKANYSGSINLVDLAGSESAKTSSTERLNETKSINKSLSTLGTVMLALHNKDSHVPYRNSKLTYLLQSCLGGNSKTLMFVNISPFEDCFLESVNSLRFASKVKEIKMTAKKNKTYCIGGLQNTK